MPGRRSGSCFGPAAHYATWRVGGEVSPPTVSWWKAGSPGTWTGLGGSELAFIFILCLVSHIVHVFVFCPRAPQRSGMPEGAQQERTPWGKRTWGMFHPPSCGSSILGGFCMLLGDLIKVGLLSRVTTPIMTPYYFAFLFSPCVIFLCSLESP